MKGATTRSRILPSLHQMTQPEVTARQIFDTLERTHYITISDISMTLTKSKCKRRKIRIQQGYGNNLITHFDRQDAIQKLGE